MSSFDEDTLVVASEQEVNLEVEQLGQVPGLHRQAELLTFSLLGIQF